jgi:Recombinase
MSKSWPLTVSTSMRSRGSYSIERVPHGAEIVRCVVMHPERRGVYRLLWDMAIDGATVNSIVRELAARGYRTAPARTRPRPFDATRVGKVIVNPFYAGLVVSRREIVGAGNWPAYVEPDIWHRLRRERSERARYRPEPVGRPPGESA